MSGRIYPPHFYKYLTERADWDISSEEVYGREAEFERYYQEYMQEMEKLVKKLEDLASEGKVGTPEYQKIWAELDLYAPELAKKIA